MTTRSVLLWLVLIAGSLAAPCSEVWAGDSNLEVDDVDFSLQDGAYLLSAKISYRLTDTARDALQKGIPLFWDVLIKVEQQRQWLWDRVLVDYKIRYRIQYQALLNRYRVSNISTGESDSFATLPAALARMAIVHNLKLLDRDALLPGQHYQVGIKISFDREALPLPLRPVSYVNPQWYLSSGWYLWPVQQ
ncbi:MAG: DUF4390 domain-containing protein [Gammaproteobacteria bacterium]